MSLLHKLISETPGCSIVPWIFDPLLRKIPKGCPEDDLGGVGARAPIQNRRCSGKREFAVGDESFAKLTFAATN